MTTKKINATIKDKKGEKDGEMKKRRLKKPHRIIINILLIALFYIIAILTINLYIEKSDKINKQKNECIKQAQTPAQKIKCYN